MIMIALMLAGADPFAGPRADIAEFCRGRGARCETEQRRQMGYFVTMMAGFRDPRQQNATACMRAGKQGHHVDWTIAASCMRSRVQGRRLGG